ncbi:MAG TPA: hypothetical protein VKB43_11820 [Gaiellaceae bacterium]|nr:hypothetical protein [Gaiellaceae bacterium]
MFKRLIIVATTAATLALAGGAAGIASADPIPSVDFGNCAFGPGGANVQAGTAFTVTDTGASATGNYGTALHAWKTATVSATITYGDGTTTTMSLAPSFPQFVGDPYFAWLSFVPDIGPLGPLASGNSVLVTLDYTNTVSGEVVFPGQKGPAPHFGPFHFGPGTDEESCVITAS